MLKGILFCIFSLLFASHAFCQDPIRIGVIAGLTGEYASVFQNWVNGIRLAQEEYQKNKRLPKVDLFVEDDEFRAASGLAAYHKLYDTTHVAALLNGSSATIGAISPLVSKTGIPVIQLGEETTIPADDNIIQIMPGNVEMERQFGAYLRERYPEDLLVFYTLHATMLRFLEGFKGGYGKPLSAIEMDPSQRDLNSVVAKGLAKKPSCIAILAFPPQGAALVKALRASGKADIPLAFDGSFQTGLNEYQQLLGDLTFLGSALVSTFPKQIDPAFIEAYQKQYGQAPGIMADLGYDAFNVLMQNYDPQSAKWVDGIKRASAGGASGSIEFDAVGIRKPKFKITTVKELEEGL